MIVRRRRSVTMWLLSVVPQRWGDKEAMQFLSRGMHGVRQSCSSCPATGLSSQRTHLHRPLEPAPYLTWTDADARGSRSARQKNSSSETGAHAGALSGRSAPHGSLPWTPADTRNPGSPRRGFTFSEIEPADPLGLVRAVAWIGVVRKSASRAGRLSPTRTRPRGKSRARTFTRVARSCLTRALIKRRSVDGERLGRQNGQDRVESPA
jgi:hypothetical protein